MPEGMGRMIQMISALAQIQNQRRALDQQERQHEEAKRQFGLQLGFNEKSQEYKKFADLVDLYGRSAAEARGAIDELAQQAFPNDPAKQQALKHFGLSAPETAEAIKNVAIGRGFRNPSTATPQELEAASQATTGMPTGGVAQSGLQAILAARAQPFVTPQMSQGYAERAATGREPLAAGVQSRILGDPNLIAKLAGVTAGTEMSAPQAAQADIGAGGVQAQFAGVRQRDVEAQSQFIEHLMQQSARGALTGSDIIAGYKYLTDITNDIATKKGDKNFTLQKMAEYNRMAAILDPSLMRNDPNTLPDAAGLMERARRALGGSPPGLTPPVGLAPPGPAAPPTQPFMSTPQPQMFGPIPNYNPLMQFVRP